MRTRIDRHLARHGFGSRSAVHALLRAGRVQVDGVSIRDAAAQIDPAREQVAVDGVRVQYREALHVMLNKPAGLLTAARDASARTVMDILPDLFPAMNCMPVGRLDKDTEGLLLLTSDGQLAHRLLSPRRHIDKVYLAQVDARLDDADMRAFAGGIQLSDFRAMPAELEILPGAMQARVTVQEGKFHQVKRMFHACGKDVVQLKRIAFGGVALDPALQAGQWRELLAQELSQLMQATGGSGHG